MRIWEQTAAEASRQCLTTEQTCMVRNSFNREKGKPEVTVLQMAKMQFDMRVLEEIRGGKG